MCKILISGSGRCGTTFLIKLFTFLNFDTGFTKTDYEKFIFSNCNSGMEKEINAENYILKNPLFITQIEEIIKKTKIKYMIIPIRDYSESAKSRTTHQNETGGLWNATDEATQQAFFYKIMAEYLYQMVKYDINTIFLDFEKMTTDKKYLYDKLKIIFDEKNIDLELFSTEYDLAEKSSKPSVQ